MSCVSIVLETLIHSFLGKQQYAAIAPKRLTIKLSKILGLECSTCAIFLSSLLTDSIMVRFLRKSIMISIISVFDRVEARWYVCFVRGFSVYFAIIASKNLQKSSAIQNNSISFLSVIIAIIVRNSLYLVL